MSYVLRFLHAPHITTAREAMAWADGPHPLPRQRNPHFAEFVRRITEYYPVLWDRDGGAHERSLWPEGLESTVDDGAVVNVLINTDLFDDGVMTVIAREADAAGLRVLDPQSGALYGPGLQSIAPGETTPVPLPEITNFAFAAMTENLRGLRFDAARKKIATALRQGLGAPARTGEGASVTAVSRNHGKLRQLMLLRVMRSTDGKRARVYVRLGFSCPPLRKIWQPLMPESFVQRKARYDAADGGTALEFAVWATDIARGALPASLSLPTDSTMGFANAAELKALVTATQTWAREQLLPFLDPLRDAEDLLPLFIHEAGRQHAREGSVQFPIYPAMLTLARRAGLPTFEAWAEAYRANPDLSRLCRVFKDPECEHFNALVEGLRRGS